MIVSSRPRSLEALKHLLWTDDESRHVETALEDAFKSRASLGANWLINVGGTFSCNALPLFWDPCRTFCARKIPFTCIDKAVCNRTARRIHKILARIPFNMAHEIFIEACDETRFS